MAVHGPDADAWSIRAARQEDVHAIATIETACFQQPLPYRYIQQSVEGARVGVATAEGAVGGFVIYRMVPTAAGRRGHLADLAVGASVRRQGLGRALLRWALRRLRGCTEVWLEVRASNHVARALYASAGFTPVSRRRRYYTDGEDALVLTRAMGRGP